MKKKPKTDAELEEFINTNQEALQEIAKEIVARRLILRTHIGLWIFVNILTGLIYELSDSVDHWYVWVVVPWAFAIMLHVFNFEMFRNGRLSSGQEYVFAYHVFLYVSINILLIFIDGFGATPLWIFDWFWWPLGGWGFLFLIHCMIYAKIDADFNKYKKK